MNTTPDVLVFDEKGGMRQVFIPLRILLTWKWEDNPKLHSAPLIEDSVRRYGFNDPVEAVVNLELIVVGHGRLELLEKLHWAWVQRRPGNFVPNNIIAFDEDEARVTAEGIKLEAGDWLIPVIDLDFESREQALLYALAHNRSNSSALHAADYDRAKFKTATEKALAAGQMDMLAAAGFGKADLEAAGWGELIQVPEIPEWDSPLALAPGGAAEAEVVTGGGDALPPDSHIGMLNLFFTQESRAVFVKRCERLAKALGLKSITEVVAAVVEEKFKATFGAMAEQPATVLPGQIGFSGEVVGEPVTDLDSALWEPLGIRRPDAPQIGEASAGEGGMAGYISGIFMGPIAGEKLTELPGWDEPGSFIKEQSLADNGGQKPEVKSGPEWVGDLCKACGGSGFTGYSRGAEGKMVRDDCEACEGAGDKATYEAKRLGAQTGMF